MKQQRLAARGASAPLRLVPGSDGVGASPAERLEALERERDELWRWVFHLERLAQAGLMAGGLAHDTRNLLTGISGFCQVALESAHVNLVPGSAFGAEGYVRLSFAASREQINGGLDQLEKLLVT